MEGGLGVVGRVVLGGLGEESGGVLDWLEEVE